MSEINQAQGGGDVLPAIIWLIFLAIWAVGQLVRRLTGNQETDEPAQPRKARSNLETELRDFIETITGEPLDAPPEPSRPAPQPPPTPRARERVTLPPVTVRAPTSRSSATQPGTQSTGDTPMVASTVIEAQVEILAAPNLHGTHKYMLSGAEGIKLKMPGMNTPDTERQTSAKTRYSIPDRKALKRAMIDRIVLGPPRGICDFVRENQQSSM